MLWFFVVFIVVVHFSLIFIKWKIIESHLKRYVKLLLLLFFQEKKTYVSHLRPFSTFSTVVYMKSLSIITADCTMYMENGLVLLLLFYFINLSMLLRIHTFEILHIIWKRDCMSLKFDTIIRTIIDMEKSILWKINK